MRTPFVIRRPDSLRSKRLARGEAGATLIEMVVAMAILMFGLLGMVGAMGWGLKMSQRIRFMTDTKMTITSMLEQMETLRNTRRLTFGQIANEGKVNNIGAQQIFAGFPNGFQPVSSNPGPDGIYGTGDDLQERGPGGQLITNQALARPGYKREIVITTLSSNLIKIQVKMRYPGRSGETQELVGVSYLNNDSNSNFR
jgi:hypothetical protein